MKQFVVLLLLAGCAAPVAPAATPPPPAPAPSDHPAAIETQSVPPIPPELARRLVQYQSARAASFEDWGPDGSILISTRFAETAQLHLVPFPGGRREQLSFTEEPVAAGRFIPGTPDLIYTQARGGDENYQIYRLDRTSGRSTPLSDGKSRNNLGPLSRDGGRLAYTSTRRNGRDADLYVLDLKTGLSTLTMEVKNEFWSPSDWSPDGSKLAMLKVVSVTNSTPFVLDLTTKEKTAYRSSAGEGPVAHGAPRFSPDGRALLFSSDARGEFRELCIAGATTEFRKTDWDVVDVEAHGERLAVVLNEDGASKVTLSNPDIVLPLPPGVVSDLRFSPDGRRLGFTLSRADAPADVYTWEIAESKLLRWTFSEVGGLDPARFVVPERIRYPSFDGRQIPAYVYKPKGATKAPVIISIHGGPESQYQPFFSGLTQFWVSELGIALVAPNVRGSTGYGKTYTTLDNAEKREDSVKDIGALLDWIAKQPDLDASRVAVLGGSYGGYMVLASLVHYGERLKAGVDIVGIGDFISFLEKTSGYRVDLRRVEYGDERDPKMRAVFERISPARQAQKIRSALLVAHGRNDPRVPFFEAEQIAANVRSRGLPVWTVYAANEGHGFARKENRDYLSAAMTVFLKSILLDSSQ